MCQTRVDCWWRSELGLKACGEAPVPMVRNIAAKRETKKILQQLRFQFQFSNLHCRMIFSKHFPRRWWPESSSELVDPHHIVADGVSPPRKSLPKYNMLRVSIHSSCVDDYSVNCCKYNSNIEKSWQACFKLSRVISKRKNLNWISVPQWEKRKPAGVYQIVWGHFNKHKVRG